VTHDQAEAMTTADLIAVMNLGRIEQLGTPKEIYDSPHSAFVARFIGGSNILVGKALDAGHVAVGGGALATTGRALAKDETVSVSIRQHEIAIQLQAPASSSANFLHAVVGRQVFLGAARDYTVVLDDTTELRVTAPPAQDIAPGREVWLRLPAERCRALIKGVDA
jgi:iron(III) transport system ATP-binding protein